jgi:hypothetical protein
VTTFDTTLHLAGVQHINKFSDRDDLQDFGDTLAAVNMYRLFGHEATVETLQGDVKQPWAPVRELIIEPGSLRCKRHKREGYYLIKHQARPGRHDRIEDFRTLLSDDKTTLVIQKPILEIVEWQRRTEPVTVYTTNKKKKPVVFKVLGNFSYNPVGFTAKPAVSLGTRDFGDGRPTEAPTKPSTAPSGAARPPVDTATTGDPVDGAE